MARYSSGLQRRVGANANVYDAARGCFAVPRACHAAVCLLALTALVVTAKPAARAILRVRDDARHAEQWFRLYDELPQAWKTRRAILLREMSPRDISRLAARLGDSEADRNDDSVVDGCYQNGEAGDDGPPIITVCDTLKGDQAGLVFAHEYGHFVWNELLTEEQRVRYARVWRSQKRAHHLVTEYARESDEEGFAEAFAYFARHPSQLARKDAASTLFLRDLSAARTDAASPASSDSDSSPDHDNAHR